MADNVTQFETTESEATTDTGSRRDSKRKFEQERFYGDSFPGLGGKGEQWRDWINSRIREQEGVMRDKRLHWRTASTLPAGSAVD